MLTHPKLAEQAAMLYFCLPYQLPPADQTLRLLVCAWPYDEFPPACAQQPLDAWRRGFASCRGALVFSQQAAGAVRRLMGDSYPVQVIPAQPAERFSGLCPESGVFPKNRPRLLEFHGHLLDSPRIGLSVDGLAQGDQEFVAEPASSRRLSLRQRLGITRLLMRGWWQDAVRSYLRKPILEPESSAQLQRLKLYGTVYTCVLRAEDTHFRWADMLSAFCLTFRDEPNATLVLKFTHHNESSGIIPLLTVLSRLSPFRCRVVAISAFLQADEYAALISASDYLVQASEAEASALTAQEFLSAGRPVIGPAYSALADWLTPDNAFLVKGDLQPACWVGDVDKQMHLQALRLNWESLCQAFVQSYELAQQAPELYRQKSKMARDGMRVHASNEYIGEVLKRFFLLTLNAQEGIDARRMVS
ncbi:MULTISPECIES: glycosyltransferase [unclassified Pseudomonas]|uniref:glycosyltransferase n=1 Tax=unclassified Pseudomonas TaxID=196821 RepID=UPI00244B67C1|nr:MULTISPECIES: glycosyltransferase [unclassified Pseudomonas]MDG9925187.1 glycosyltransferase [Pseudomonas sp. GD04045]MDH0035317.1 glycosyltransferase [Pseudomonas sp. GD04019]